MVGDESEVTQLLQRWTAGDVEALDRLVPMLYEPLRDLARRRLQREQSGRSLDTTGLVHEAYLRLAGGDALSLRDRQQFLAIASRVMRNVLVDRARARNAEKRGGGAAVVELREELWASQLDLDVVADLDEALRRLDTLEPRQSTILEQHYFGGLTIEETAGAMNLSARTVKRDLRAARAWLALELAADRRAAS